MTPLLVAVGALAGAPLRLLATRMAARAGRDPAPGTLAVNVAGSALLGVLLGLGGVPAPVLALVGTGFCGTLTTFSGLGADLVRMVEERAVARAVAVVATSFVLGLGPRRPVGYLPAERLRVPLAFTSSAQGPKVPARP